MQRFSVRLLKEGFGATAVTPPQDIVIVPERWSADDRGGMKQATFSAGGSAESLASLCSWLGDRIEIYNPAGDCVWYGFLYDIEVTLDHSNISLSLDNLYNRIAVTYPYQLADGSEESRTTDWVEDSNSINHFGTRELLYAKPSSFRSAAETVRDQLLSRLSNPAPVITTQAQSAYEARLTAQGYWYKAAGIYFNNPDGLVEYTGENGSQTIGYYYESDQISFGADTPGGETDEIYDAGSGFAFLSVGDSFTLSGSAHAGNNGTFRVENMDDVHQIGISGTWTDEAAGNTIKITPGDQESFDNIAMSFTPATSWTCTHVAVKCRRIGTPSDNFRIGIYPDSSGVPGTVLTANETLGSALFTELTWTEFEFSTPVALTGGSTYWIGIRRTGSADPTDAYEVAMDEDLGYSGGTAILYNGSSWVTRSPDADMPFRVIGEIDSTEQIRKCIAAVDDFTYALIQVDSDIAIRQYTDTLRFVSDELGEMLDAGVSTGERLIAWVNYDNAVIVNLASEDIFTDKLVLGSNGKVRYGNGSPYAQGRLLFGRYVEVDGLLLANGLGISGPRGGSIYIQSSEYDAESDMLSVETEGAFDPLQALTITKG